MVMKIKITWKVMPFLRESLGLIEAPNLGLAWMAFSLQNILSDFLANRQPWVNCLLLM